MANGGHTVQWVQMLGSRVGMGNTFFPASVLILKHMMGFFYLLLNISHKKIQIYP